jgi:hypothetical protein
MAGGAGEWQRRAEEAWRRAERLGAFLEVGRTIQVGDETVEVVATLADATQTVVAYRAPEGSGVLPSLVDPPGGASGRTMGDLLVAHMPPAEGSTVLVSFGDFDEGPDVELPIDRTRTRPFERQCPTLPAPFIADGARVAILGAAVGLLMATVDLEVTSDDPTLAAATIGARGVLPHPHRLAGQGPLWQEWFPPPEQSPAPAQNVGQGPPSQVEVRFRASATARARLARRSKHSPTAAPARSLPWEVRAQPGGQLLPTQGGSGRGGPVPDALLMGTTLQFDPPPDDALALELVLNELFIFRSCDGEVVEVPGPRPGEAVDLRGQSLASGPDRLDLVRWQTGVQGNPQLVVRPSRPELWPDIRVVGGNASVSLWLRPDGPDELVGGLPGMYESLFPAGGQVVLGMRMLGRRAHVPPVTIPLAGP